MLKIPDSRLSASNSAVLASESFLIPMTLQVEARSLPAAAEDLRLAFDEVKEFVPRLAGTAPGTTLVAFDAAVSPRLSRVDLVRHGKDYRFHLTFSIKCPIAKEKDFWERIHFVSLVYDRLSELVAVFKDRKGIDFYLEEARLDQQKEDSERFRLYRK